MKKNQGMSLVGVMVAIGVLGVVALGVAKLGLNMGQIKRDAYNTQDESNLQSIVSRLYSRPNKHCRVNFARTTSDNPPVYIDPIKYPPIANFRKTQHDEIDDPDEGYEIELYYSSPDGNNFSRKFLSSTDPKVNQFGLLKITGVKLFWPEPTSTSPLVYGNYPNNDNFSDIAKLVVFYEKKVGSEYQPRRLMVDTTLNMRSSGGSTTVIGCEYEPGPDAPATRRESCEMAGSYYDENKNPPCQRSRGYPTMLPRRGGDGGSASTLSCPHGSAIVGIKGRSDARVDGLAVICKDIDPSTLKPVVGSVAYTSILAGGTGGNSFYDPIQDVCPTGTFAYGIRGKADRLVDAIRLLCRDYETNTGNSETKLRGGSGGDPYNDSCPNNTVLREISIRSGSEIDSVRAVCW